MEVNKILVGDFYNFRGVETHYYVIIGFTRKNILNINSDILVHIIEVSYRDDGNLVNFQLLYSQFEKEVNKGYWKNIGIWK
jgi:hypothetical protein